MSIANEARKTYRDWFCDGMSERGIEVAHEVTNLNDLEFYREQISAGEFDAIESAIVHTQEK
jgi:hypothetical protein